MKIKLLKAILVFAVVLSGAIVLTSHNKAYAATYCAVLAPATTPTNCAAGQDYTTCTLMQNSADSTYFGAWPDCGNGASQVELKQTFINNMTTYMNSGQYFQKTGADWIMSQLGATSISDFTNRINLSSVTLGIDCFSYTKSAGYNASTSSIATFSDTQTGPSGCNGGNYTTEYSTYSLIIYVSGVEYFAAVLNSGSPVGTIKALPTAPSQPGNNYNLESNVIMVPANGSSVVQVPGVKFVQPCGGLTNQTPGSSLTSTQISNLVSPAPYNSGYYYSSIPTGDAYCLQIQSTAYSSDAYIPGYDGPFTRPWDYGHASEDNYPSVVGSGISSAVACSGPFSTTNYQEHCPTYSYGCQVAQEYASTDGCGDKSYDNAVDAGLDFDYTALTSSCSGISYCNVNMPTCSLTGPSSPTANTGFNATYSISNNALIASLDFAPSGSYTLSLSSNPSIAISFTTPTFTVGNKSSSNSTQTGTISIPGVPSGSYTLTLSINVKSLSGNSYNTLVNCAPYTFVTANQTYHPYLKVFGGDVVAGADSDSMNYCYDNTTASLSSWNNTSSGAGNYGAGTTAAAIATGPISEFTTGQSFINTITDLNPLSLSSTGTSVGDFVSSQATCPSNLYYSPTLPSCSLVAPQLASGGTISSNIICGATGNITIGGDIVPESLVGLSPSQYPSLEVIDYGGSIYIPSTVHNLFGTYIAEKNGSSGSGGVINDDAVAPYYSYSDQQSCAGTNNTCNVPSKDDRLVVQGSFIADTLHLYRSYGDALLGPTTTTSTPPDSNAAEEFDYTPLVWLSPSSTSGLGNPESIASLPPVQ